ncbi:hypothetical protein QJQ45_010298 [Haematococcus lacustris]|nr:hypothetical protein QJQ45_010298 [Haematococcus lacustris]
MPPKRKRKRPVTPAQGAAGPAPCPAPTWPSVTPPGPPMGWLDRDTNPCLNSQRIGESKQRPLELCSWKDLEALPTVGKEYHQRYKLVNDRLPKPPQAPCSSQAATQPAASEPRPSIPPPAKRSKRTKAEQAAEPTQPTKAAKTKPEPQPGRWLDRDCNAALNMQRIGESRWRPLELCWWPEQGALPAKGKEDPGLGYKRLRDKPPKAQ